MKILVTNDDGIRTEGLEILANWARKLGEVTVVAPKTQQSAMSHSINIRTPFEVKKVDWLEGIDCYSVDSTPADCVRFAINGLMKEFDLVLSGINKGYNLGEDIAYSGTDAVIFEAAYFGCKGIAFSTDFDSYSGAAEKVDAAYRHIIENHYFDHNLIFNVNFPTSESKGVLLTRQGDAYYKDMFDEVEPDMYLAHGYSMYKGTERLDMDLDATMCGYTSVTPVSVCRTAMEAYLKLKG